MQIIQRNNFGTVEHIANLILSTKVYIGSDKINGYTVIAAQVTIQTAPNCSCMEQVTIAKYTGSTHLNNGLLVNKTLPFQVTINAQKIWDSFVDEVGKELLSYINEK